MNNELPPNHASSRILRNVRWHILTSFERFSLRILINRSFTAFYLLADEKNLHHHFFLSWRNYFQFTATKNPSLAKNIKTYTERSRRLIAYTHNMNTFFSNAGVTLCNLLHNYFTFYVLGILWLIKVYSTYLWPSLLN